MMITRRNFVAGLATLLAAPAIVRIASIMPVRSIDRFEWNNDVWRDVDIKRTMIEADDLVVVKNHFGEESFARIPLGDLVSDLKPSDTANKLASLFQEQRRRDRAKFWNGLKEMSPA